ncbi:MAG TPA: nucleotidyltransferase [Thermodesulfobacteriota bacterium]
MFTFGTHFDALFSSIQPPKERLDAARELPPRVREYLEKHAEFATLYPHTKLAGSYAQDTSVGDVKDVDFLVRVPGNPNENYLSAKKLIQELKCVLDELPKALGYLGFAAIDDIEIERARRSVHVYFKGKDFHIDVVPCIAPEGFDKVLFVPDRGFNKWIASHPIGYISLLKELNDQHGGKVRPLIKLIKHFRNVHMVNRKPKSYWLGALVIHHIRKDNGLDTSKSLAELFRDLCDGVYQQYDHLLRVNDSVTPNIPDPLLGHNISWNWTRSHFETFMRRLDDGRSWAEKALKATDREVALDYWQRIFGEDYFKRDVEDSALKMATSALPGQSFITSNGVIQPERRESGLYTPIKKTTFHGKA